MTNIFNYAALLMAGGRKKQFHEMAENLWKNEYRFETFEYVYEGLRTGKIDGIVGDVK